MTKIYYTAEQLHKKYPNRYIEIYRRYDGMYEVIKTYSDIHENTTLGIDVGTPLEYRR